MPRIDVWWMPHSYAASLLIVQEYQTVVTPIRVNEVRVLGHYHQMIHLVSEAQESVSNWTILSKSVSCAALTSRVWMLYGIYHFKGQFYYGGIWLVIHMNGTIYKAFQSVLRLLWNYIISLLHKIISHRLKRVLNLSRAKPVFSFFLMFNSF